MSTIRGDLLTLIGLALMVAAGKIKQYTTDQTWWYVSDYAKDLGTLLVGSRAVTSLRGQVKEKKEDEVPSV